MNIIARGPHNQTEKKKSNQIKEYTCGKQARHLLQRKILLVNYETLLLRSTFSQPSVRCL